MAAKQAAKSSSAGPDSPLTEAENKALRREFGNGFRDFADEVWRQFKELLEEGAKRRLRGLTIPTTRRGRSALF